MGDHTHDSAEVQRGPEWRALFLVAFLVWLTPTLVGVIAKSWFLGKHGFADVAGALSLSSLSPGQRLSFFRADLVFGLVLAPAGFLVARALLPIRWYSWTIGAVAAIAVLLQLVAFGEFVVLGNLARYALLAEGLDWGMSHPMAALEYLLAALDLSHPAHLIKSLVIVGAIAAAIFVVWRAIRHHGQTVEKQIYAVTVALWVVGAALAIAAWFPWMRPTVFHSAMISLTARSLVASEGSAAVYDDVPIGALRPIYEKLAHAPTPGSPRPYWGAAKDYDVVLFIMETGPARILSADTSLNDFPNLKRLSRSAWVATQHYTTSPESFRVITSILLSTYPVSHNRSFLENRRTPPGLIQNLHAAGYRTGIYMTNVHGSRYAREEESYYMTMAPDTVFIPDAPSRPSESALKWQEEEQVDLAALRKLEEDYRASASTGRRFLGVYLPQLSHEPWVDVSAAGNESDMAKRRYNLMKLEDRHLGELLTTIQESGRLDRTLIVVTCDHGLRSSESDPSFRPGQIDDLTFHVPFLLYAPRIVKTRTNLSWPTSHIDVGPSILDLLGISVGRDFEAGSAIWNEGLKDRGIFFWASHYFGADGYYFHDAFSMWNPMLNVTYRSRALHFDAAAAVPQDSPAHNEIIEQVENMGALVDAWYNLAVLARAP
ncbi:MAG TPA: sulfatase-like hydrolase/transferase [Gemmatimonadales bacterium]|nr:sulfatase-like hydrolase/transferase [Gemmatimonadales bacterium]